MHWVYEKLRQPPQRKSPMNTDRLWRPPHHLPSPPLPPTTKENVQYQRTAETLRQANDTHQALRGVVLDRVDQPDPDVQLGLAELAVRLVPEAAALVVPDEGRRRRVALLLLLLRRRRRAERKVLQRDGGDGRRGGNGTGRALVMIVDFLSTRRSRRFRFLFTRPFREGQPFVPLFLLRGSTTEMIYEAPRTPTIIGQQWEGAGYSSGRGRGYVGEWEERGQENRKSTCAYRPRRRRAGSGGI